MKNLIDKIRSFFSHLQLRAVQVSLGEKFKRKPNVVPAVNEPPTTPRKKGKLDRFTAISWVVTLVIVVSLLISTILYKNAQASTVISAPQATPESGNGKPVVPVIGAEGNGFSSIPRELQLKTIIPERPRYEATTYRVTSGDAMLRIAEKFNLKTETLLYVNTQLDDNPHNLKPGMELTIPPVDGLYYQWNEGDTFETIATKFDTTPDEIMNFPGNKVDLTNPSIEAGVKVMIPGGLRELRDWTQDLQTASRSNNGSTGTSDFGGNICGGGPVASGFGWPATSHNISGNGYGPGHLAIDIQANEGEPVYASGSGVVTMAQGGWNYGYGNVIQIDHGNGYVTVYAHLSQINVGVCTPVGQGTLIGLAGNTGNSFGAHLHFEVRSGGAIINPYEIVQ